MSHTKILGMIDQLPVKPQIFRSAGYPKNVSPVAHLMSLRIHVKNIPKWKRRKQNIFSQMISFQHWTLWCNCKTHSRWKLLKRSKVKKKICSIFTLLGMFVMLLLFHLSLGDGQCSWNLNIIKAFQGPLPKKLETSRAKVQTLRKGGEKKILVPTTCLIGWKIDHHLIFLSKPVTKRYQIKKKDGTSCKYLKLC